MSTQVFAILRELQWVLVIPEEFIEKVDRLVNRRLLSTPVVTGLKSGGYVEILSGLKERDLVYRLRE